MIDVDLLNYPLNKRERAAKHMKNTFGNSVSVTIFGESHGSEIGVVLDGLAPGIQVKEDEIAEKLRLRRPSGSISTKRVEPDHFRIVYLPMLPTLRTAIGKIGHFLETYRQD